MAYLRPLNSSEANLFVIRFTSPVVTSDKLTVLSGNYDGYYGVNESIYAIPTSDLLPTGFKYMLGGASKNNYKIVFGTMSNPFTEPPTVIITINKKDINDNDINRYNVMLTNVTTSYVDFTVINNNDDTEITPYNGTTIKAPIFNVIILGSVMSGATFAISNRGWNVPESAVNKLYTYQSVGVGTGKVDGTFNLKGTTVTPAYIVTYSEGDSLGTITANIVANTLTLLTIPTTLTNDVKFELPAGKNGQMIKISITNNYFNDQDDANKIYIKGSCLNTGNDFVIAEDTGINKMTELYYDETLSKWRVINYSRFTPIPP